MAIFKFSFTIVSSVIPVALIACGSAYGIHILTHYYIALDEEVKKGTVITKEIHKQVILRGVGDCKVAVFLAAVTTVIGFISLVTSPMGPLHSFAIFTAVGVALAFIFSVTFIPAVLMVKSEKAIGKKSKLMQRVSTKVKKHTINRGTASHDTLFNIFTFFCGTKPRMYVFGAFIIILSIFGIRRLTIETSIINYFPKDSQMRQDIDYVDKRFAGTNMIFMLVDGPKVTDAEGNVLDENGVPVMNKDGKFLDVNGNIIKKSDGREAALVEGSMKNPDILEAIDGLQDNIYNKFPFVGKMISFPTLVKRMNQVLHAPSADAINTATAGTDSFGSDDFGGFDDFAGFDDFGDFGDFGDTSAESADYEMLPDYVDPNVAYVEKLNSTISVDEALTLLINSYAEAGGSNASVKDVVEVLEKKLNYKGKDFTKFLMTKQNTVMHSTKPLQTL